MEYYFKIAGVKIKIDADTEFDWNPHIRTFASEAFAQADEVYKIRMADELRQNRISGCDLFLAEKAGHCISECFVKTVRRSVQICGEAADRRAE